MSKNKNPSAIFDSFEFFQDEDNFAYLSNEYNLSDVKQAHSFLKAYRGSAGTFNAYRREIERLLQWCALVANKSLNELKRVDIEDFVEFSQNPPKNWIGFIDLELLDLAS